MKNKSKLFGIYLPIYLFVLAAAVTLRTVALYLDYVPSTGYFDGKALISTADYFVIFTSVFLFTYTFTARRDIKLIPSFTGPATYVPTAAVFVGLCFMIQAISDEYAAKEALIKHYMILGTPAMLQQIPSVRILLALLIVALIFALLSAVHFILTALVESHSSTKRAYFGLCTTVFFSVYAAYTYFNTELPINAPNKVLDQITFLFLAVFFLFEARLSIGREKWRGYIAFGFIASLLAAYSSIPAMIYYFGTKIEASNSIYETALTFAIFIFIIARVLLTGELVEDIPSRSVKALIASAEEREQAVNPAPMLCDIIEIEGEELDASETYEENDENQISIDDMDIVPLEISSEEESAPEEVKE